MLAIALLLGSLAQAVPALDPEAFDLRCFIASSQLQLRATDAEMRANATAAGIFFLGRVDAKIPAAELEERLFRTGVALQGADLRPLWRSCGAFMQERGRVMSEIGARITARERARQSR
jgi:hypothetical protein